MDYATGYVRLSHAAGTDNLSLPGMITDIERRAEALGVPLIAVHVDDGKSGAVRDRPAFLAWLEDVRTGRAAVMITWHADRLTREGINVAGMILDVQEGKNPATGAVERTPARLVDCAGLDSNDREGFRFRFVIGAEVARGELERIKARNQAMHARLKAAGRWNGGQPAFGMKAVPNRDGGGKILGLNEAEYETLERIADALILGQAPGRIARRLNEDGVATRTGVPWVRNRVVEVIQGDGAMLLSAGKRVAARRAIEERATGQKDSGRPRRLLSGRVKCAGCGSGLVAGSGQTPVYRCNYTSQGRECAVRATISAARLDEYVTDLFLSDFGHLPVTERYTITTGPEARIAAAEEARTRALADLRRKSSREAFERLEAADAELAAAAGEPTVTEERVRETGQTVAEAWADRGTDWRREVLFAWPVEIAIGPGNRRSGRRFDHGRVTVTPVEGGGWAE